MDPDHSTKFRAVRSIPKALKSCAGGFATLKDSRSTFLCWNSKLGDFR
jgi:hypothetical protein